MKGTTCIIIQVVKKYFRPIMSLSVVALKAKTMVYAEFNRLSRSSCLFSQKIRNTARHFRKQEYLRNYKKARANLWIPADKRGASSKKPKAKT